MSFKKSFGLALWLMPLTLLAAEDNQLSLKQMLLMPGDLVEAHAEFESKCNDCHEDFDKQNQTRLCLDCHEQISEDLKTKSGFHSHLEKQQQENCNSCHSDHLGRDADIIGLDQDQFDHKLTDFHLKGAHQTVACESCHLQLNSKSTEEKGFRLAKKECKDCHDDVHKGELGEQCTDCHNEKNWKENKFDHEKTDFPLKGEHQQLICSACHSNQQFEKGRTECIACHLGKDKHFGRFGEKCQDCHQEKSWTKTTFDHKKDANFLLKGRHQSISCESCHRKGLPLDLPKECIDCHQAEDIHRNANGSECEQCHSEKSWKKTEFDHNKDTDFLLKDSHSKVNCEGCHIGAVRKKSESSSESSSVAGTKCVDCHRTIDPHNGKLGKQCESCHNEKNWQEKINFSHDFSSFPLTGAHQSLPCESCHQDKQFLKTPSECEACHIGDDFHERTLGESCGSCHNTSAWMSWSFDHDSTTRFSLEGVHRDLSCELCHDSQQADPLKPMMRCVSCHQQDDIHRGDFGPDCQQCHGTDTFDDIR